MHDKITRRGPDRTFMGVPSTQERKKRAEEGEKGKPPLSFWNSGITTNIEHTPLLVGVSDGSLESLSHSGVGFSSSMCKDQADAPGESSEENERDTRRGRMWSRIISHKNKGGGGRKIE